MKQKSTFFINVWTKKFKLHAQSNRIQRETRNKIIEINNSNCLHRAGQKPAFISLIISGVLSLIFVIFGTRIPTFTKFDYYTGKLEIVEEIAYSKGERAKVRCYGADDVREGVAIMHHEGVDVSITGNSTNPTRFQHPVAGTYKKECIEMGKKYFSVASGGGTGRTLHPDNMAAGPASYGMTDTMGRMHSDAQFAGSSSVPAHVEMMGLIGAGNNPMVGMTVACAVAVNEALNK